MYSGEKVYNDVKFDKKIKKIVYIIILSLLTITIPNKTVYAKTINKGVVICKISNKKLTYRKSIFATKYLEDPDWENIIGYGKAMTRKISSKAKFYLLDDADYRPNGRLIKVSKKFFIKRVRLQGVTKESFKGKVFYYGLACKVTIKNGRIVKVKQVYQA